MSDNFLSTVAAITDLLNSPQRDADKIGLLARSLRWHKAYDDIDLAALLTLGRLVRRKKGPGCWEVERVVLEVLCEQASVEHIPLLIETLRDKRRGKHSNDRRRLALQALSGVAAGTANEEVLMVLEEGLSHHKKDTRGWAIGFLLDAYTHLNRPLPLSVINQLRFLTKNDISADVRVEAVTALAGLGLVDQAQVEQVITAAQEQTNQAGSH